MIELSQVTKRFGRRVAVDDLSLQVPRGGIFGLLGHNGAGKSTIMGMLLGQIFPTGGRLRINDHDVFASRRAALARVGAIYESPVFYDYLSGLHNLRILCQYTGDVNETRLKEVIELVGLTERIGDKVRVYSHGMRQRLALAQALLPNPDLLILDEPSDGLDPQGMHDMRRLVRRLNREWGLTILFSSHLLHEVEQLCDHLAVLHEGKLVFEGQWRGGEMSGRWLRLDTDRRDEALAALRNEGMVGDTLPDGRIELADGHDVATINGWLVQRGYRVQAIGLVEPTLEDFYLDTVKYERKNEDT